VRIGVGLLLAAAAALALLPNITGYSSLDGTVNARLVNVAAAIEGTVMNSPPRPGVRVSRGEHLLTIHNERVDTRRLSELTTEFAATQLQIKAYSDQGAELERVRSELRARLTAFQEATVRNLEHEVGVQRARIAIAEARAGETSGDFNRKQRLRTGGFIAESDFDRTLYASVVTRNENEVSQIELARLENQLSSARQGVFISDSRNDVPYSLQRVDEVTIALADIATKRSEQIARKDKLHQQIKDEQERVKNLGAQSINAPQDGVMWRAYVREGSSVVQGAELGRILDCSELVVDVLLGESQYDEIYPGRPAQVRLIGRDDVLPGEVQSVRGSAADVEEKTMAATLPAQKSKNARIRVRLAPSVLNSDYDNYCQVGRTAQVRFESRRFPIVRWLRSLWFSIS
jgi:multidrug resistance efflux pump